MLGLLAFFIYNGVYVLVNVEAEGRVSAMSIGKAFSGVGRGAEGLLYKKYGVPFVLHRVFSLKRLTGGTFTVLFRFFFKIFDKHPSPFYLEIPSPGGINSLFYP